MTRKDNLLKVLAWRVISIVVASAITFLYIGKLRSSIELILILSVVMTIMHYIFEGWWNKRYG